MKKNAPKIFSSPINGQITLTKQHGSYALIVDGFTQSGKDIEAIWHEAFEKLLPNTHIRNILILGFGAGSIMHPIKKRWKNALVSAIELDPVMIEIAEKYFPQNFNRVSLTTTDAVTFVKGLPKRIIFDLVIVDCYIGGIQPKSSRTFALLMNLKEIATHVLFNQVFLPNKKSEMEKIAFLPLLDKSHPVKALKLPYNIIIGF